MTTFSDLGLIEPIIQALQTEGYSTPTPIQAQAIPHLLQGRDLLGCAQTGTGKTAAFALPILQRLAGVPRRNEARTCRVLVLTPTRELAAQIGDSFATYGRHLKLTHTVIFGGVGQTPQVKAVAQGIDILIATPGRLLDLMGQGHLRLDRLDTFVLDEADRMLDMGFIHDIRKVLKVLPATRQSLFFSATMPPEIAQLAGRILTDPVKVEVHPVSSTAERIEQRVMFVEKPHKLPLLSEVLKDDAIERAIVFTRTKHGADKVAKHLGQRGVKAAAIHGNKSQSARTRALDEFRTGDIRLLIATDIAARGIDIDGVTHVINFDLPNIPESYVHRIGRTARAGQSGVAISFCDTEERAYLRDIEKLTRISIPVITDHPCRDLSGTGPVAVPAQPQGKMPPRPAAQPSLRNSAPAQTKTSQAKTSQAKGPQTKSPQSRGQQASGHPPVKPPQHNAGTAQPSRPRGPQGRRQSAQKTQRA